MPNADIVEALLGAQRWLRGLSIVLRQREFSERSLQCLLGLSICERALDLTQSEGLHELASVISHQLASVRETDISSCDSKLLLLVYYIMRKHRFPAHALEEYVEKIADAFRQCEGAYEDYVGEAIILSHLGLSEYPYREVCPAMHASGLEFLYGDLEATRALYNRLCAATRFGIRECPPVPQRRLVAYMTKVLLMDALNNYDLATGAMLLRVAAYLGLARERVIEDAQSFLQLQQHSDGRFGLYDAKAEELRQAGLDPDLDLYLPLTVSCVWALAEIAIPGFRVFLLSPACTEI